MRWRYWCFFLCLAGCSENDLQDYRELGGQLVEKNYTLLEEIKTKEQLYSRKIEIKEAFKEIIILLRKTEQYRKLHPEEEIPYFTLRDQKASDRFLAQMNRILTLPGGEEILLKAQEEALLEVQNGD